MIIDGKFFTMPNEVFTLELKPKEFAVLCYLVKCSDEIGMSYPSIHTIAQNCCITDNTARKAVRYLEQRQIIKKSGGFSTSKFGRLNNSSYVYTINSDFCKAGFARKNVAEYYSQSLSD